MSGLIGLVDCNNFFVSCERLFRPDLECQPVLVLSANDGCVVARSQEVKDIGIPMGVPYFKIKDTVKDNAIQVFSGNITLYRDISRRVFAVMRREFSTVEQYSIDECFFTLTPSTTLAARLSDIRQQIRQEVGIPVSIGVASSKTLAKIATDEAKRAQGVQVFLDTAWQDRVAAMSLAQVWGVGRGLAEQYRSAGLETVGDLLEVDAALLRQRFGVVAARQQAELSGQLVYRVERKRSLQQSLMSSRSFKKTTMDQAVLADAAAYHVRHLAEELRSMQAGAQVVRVSLRTSRHGDYFLRGGSKEAVLPQATNDTFTLMSAAQDLVSSLYESAVPYQKVGVTLSHISPETREQTLFTNNEHDRSAILTAVDELNTRADRELVTLGSRLRTADWQPQSAARSQAYTTQWSDIARVSAR